MIDSALDKFAADRVGMPDFALESAGARIVHHLTSDTYQTAGGLLSTVLRWGGPPAVKPPNVILEPNVVRGNCWPFRGNHGQATVRLSETILPGNFTLEHSPPSVNPKVSSAPRDFEIWVCAQSPYFCRF